MSALASLEMFGEENPFFINWRLCRQCLQSEWPLPIFSKLCPNYSSIGDLDALDLNIGWVNVS